MKHWRYLLDGLALNKRDQRLVESYLSKGDKLAFLPLSMLLKKHGFDVEAIELLQYGVKHNPHYHSARVVLAQAFFQRGMIAQTFATLLPLLDGAEDKNFLALKLAFSCCLLLDERENATTLATQLSRINRYDKELSAWLHTLAVDGFTAARALVDEFLSLQQISCILPATQLNWQRLTIKEEPLRLEARPRSLPEKKTLPRPSRKTREIVPLDKVVQQLYG